MSAWKWLDWDVINAVHESQLAEHGGDVGIRNPGLLESAMERAKNLAAYASPSPDAAALAAAYGYGLSRNPPFIDGNKRTGFVAMELFLVLNGYQLAADDASCVLTMLAVAAGDIKEHDFAAWIRARMTESSLPS